MTALHVSDMHENSFARDIVLKLERFMFNYENMATNSFVLFHHITKRVADTTEEAHGNKCRRKELQVQQYGNAIARPDDTISVVGTKHAERAQNAPASNATAPSFNASSSNAPASTSNAPAPTSNAPNTGVFNKPKASTTVSCDGTYIPFQKDKLFWCFYIALKGLTEYEFHRSDSFSVEKALKYEAVERLSQAKHALKTHKLTHAEISDDLTHSDQISTKSLLMLCVLYELNIYLVDGRRYYKLLYGPSTPSIIHVVMRCPVTKHWSFQIQVQPGFIQELADNYFLIERVDGGLRPLSSYSAEELRLMCAQLNLPVFNEHGRKLTKPQLYERILKEN